MAQVNKIDENLYSRQLYSIGHDAMQKMVLTKVLISGMTGLGLEIAKNTILQGFKAVTIHDTEKVTKYDLSTNYYVSSRDIGRNRAEVCFEKLEELNSYVKVDYKTVPLKNELLLDYNIVVLINYPLEKQIEINNFTHNNKIHFISTSTFGLVGQIFCDYGKEFTVIDQDGEQLKTTLIESVENSVKPIVKCVDNLPHGLTNGNIIKFSNVKGMIELNNLESEIEYIDRFSFRVKIDTSFFNKYIGGGEITEVKEKRIMNFLNLKDSLKNPEFVMTDFTDFEKPNKLHAMCLSSSCGSFQNFIDQVKQYFSGEISSELLEKFYYTYNGQLGPMNSIIGGIVAQEVLKACSGKFTPIYQWFYFDAFTCLPDNYKEVDRSTKNSRYYSQIQVFGNEFQQKLLNMKYFIVGSGAIGCELLKNFALIGLGCGPQGKLYITDMDTIEKSNLNRQFLFRDKDIGKAKSITAGNAIKMMNPDINIEALLDRMGPETENVYDMNFFKALDGVANALDNVQARLYVDSRCVLFKKSLLESGTLGTKANVQVVVPYLTESYGSSIDPPEESFPVCTIKTFPNQIQHCIQWSREQFEDLFSHRPKLALEYISNPEKVKNITASDTISFVENVKFVLNNIPKNFEDCVNLALKQFHENYAQQIYDLLYKFPEDHVTSTGSKFWSGPKKCPHTILFDKNNQAHIDYVNAFSSIWANIFGVSKDTNILDRIVKKYVNPKLIINGEIKISLTEQEEQEKKKLEEERSKILDLSELLLTLPDPSLYKGLVINPQDFEKDNDSNFHIDFITASSNMRAINYDIEVASRHNTKGIAGKIIAALSTTTSVVAGLVTLELYKLAQGFTNVEKYNNTFLNLALPYIGSSDPILVKKHQVGGKEYSIWDTFVIHQDYTLGEFIKYFKDTHNLVIDTVMYGNFMIYGIMLSLAKINKRLSMKIKTIIEEELKVKLEKSITLQICTDTDDLEDDTELPEVLFIL